MCHKRKWQLGDGDINSDFYVQNARRTLPTSLSPHPGVSDTYTHHHHHHHRPLSPIKHAQPEHASTNLLTICLQFARLAPIFILSLSLPLPLPPPPFPITFSPSWARSGSGQRSKGATGRGCARLSAAHGPRELGAVAGLRGAGRPGYGVQHAGPAADPQPRSPGHARTLPHSLLRPAARRLCPPSAIGSSSWLHPGVLGLPALSPAPCTNALFGGEGRRGGVSPRAESQR